MIIIQNFCKKSNDSNNSIKKMFESQSNLIKRYWFRRKGIFKKKG